MIISAAAHGGMVLLWFLLMFASTGVLEHAGIKVPFFAFFSHDSGLRPREAPWNMLIAMGIAAFFCIFNGAFPGPLYSLMPFPVDYQPYTAAHVMGQTLLLLFASLAFVLLLMSGLYPAEMRAVNLDADWFFRKGSRLVLTVVTGIAAFIARIGEALFIRFLPSFLSNFSRRPVSRMAEAVGRAGNPGNQDRLDQLNVIPSGVPVILAVAFLYVLAFYFIVKG